MSLVTGLLTHTCSILRQAETSDGGGGFNYATATSVATLVRCMKDNRQTTIVMPNGGRQFVVQDFIIFEGSMQGTIRENDIVTHLVGPDGKVSQMTVNGKTQDETWRLGSVQNPNTLDDHLEVELKELRGRGYPAP